MFLIIDDNEEACKKLQFFLTELNIPKEEIAFCTNALIAPELLKKYSPELLFLDIELPGTDGFEVWDKLKAQGFSGHVICTTVYDSYVLKALRLQAFDYLLKPVSKEELKLALQRYEENKNIKELDFSKLEQYGLTKRQMEICRRLLEGKNNKQIAEELFLSEHTVYTHRRNILRSTGCKSSSEIISLL